MILFISRMLYLYGTVVKAASDGLFAISEALSDEQTDTLYSEDDLV